MRHTAHPHLWLGPCFGTVDVCPAGAQAEFDQFAPVAYGGSRVLNAFRHVADSIVGTDGCRLARIHEVELGDRSGQAAFWMEDGDLWMVWKSGFTGHDQLLNALWLHVLAVLAKHDPGGLRRLVECPGSTRRSR
jgi:hypothetical protein